jgi:hypothetical protein
MVTPYLQLFIKMPNGKRFPLSKLIAAMILSIILFFCGGAVREAILAA